MMSQTAKSGSSLLATPRRKHSALFFIVMAFGFFALLQSNDMFDGAFAAPMVDIRDGFVEGGEGRALRQFVRSNPDNFLMLRGADVESAFDAPELAWAEFPGVVWQYRTDSCVVDVYFASMDEDVSEAPVIHFEMRGRDGAEEIDAHSCLTGLVRERAGFFL